MHSLNAAQKTHALWPIKRFIFFFMLRNNEVVLPPKGSHPEGMGGRESDRRGCRCEVECGSAFPLFSMPSGLYDTPNFPSSPSHLPSSLSFIYFSFWLFPLLVPALPPPDNPRLLFTFVLFLLPSPLLNYSFLSLWGISCFPFLLPLPSPPPMPISTMTGCQFTGEQITAGNSASDF